MVTAQVARCGDLAFLFVVGIFESIIPVGTRR